MALGGHLRQVSDTQHLSALTESAKLSADHVGYPRSTAFAESTKFAPDNFCDRAADPRVDFVEHHAASLASRTRNLHGEGQARQLTARCDLG